MTVSERHEWLEERKKGVGGSDVASVFNVGWGCRKRLWLDKRDVAPDFPREETLAMKLGTYMEAFFAGQYADKNPNRTVMVHALPFVHPKIPEIRVNVDRSVWDENDINNPGVLEIKSVGRDVFYKYKREGMPDGYSLQLQHGMLATGYKWGIFCIGNRDSGDIMHWDVPRSEALCNEILAEVPVFWSQVENGPMPEALSPDDRRCQSCCYRTSCQGNALADAPIGDGDYEPDESLRPLVTEYLERKTLRDEAKELFDETAEELKTALGDRGKVTAAGAKIQFYKITKKEYVVKAHEERQLRVYEKKEK